MASSSSWVSDLSVWRTIGVWAQPMTAMSVDSVLMIRRSCSRGRDPSRSGSPLGIQPSREPKLPPMPPPSSVSSAGDAHTASTRRPTLHLVGRELDDRLSSGMITSVVVEQDEGPDEGLGLGLARILHRRDDGEIGDGALWGRSTSHSRSEFDGVDRAEAPAAGVDPLTGRTAQAQQPVLPGSLRGPVGCVGNGIAIGDRGQIVHHRHRLGGPASVLSFGFRRLARDEADDVVDPALPLTPPPGSHPHPYGHGVRRPSVDCVEQRRGGPVQQDEGEGEGWSSGCCIDGTATHVHDSTVPAGPTSTNSCGQFGPGRRVPLHGRHQDGVLATDARGSASRSVRS